MFCVRSASVSSGDEFVALSLRLEAAYSHRRRSYPPFPYWLRWHDDFVAVARFAVVAGSGKPASVAALDAGYSRFPGCGFDVRLSRISGRMHTVFNFQSIARIRRRDSEN